MAIPAFAMKFGPKLSRAAGSMFKAARKTGRSAYKKTLTTGARKKVATVGGAVKKAVKHPLKTVGKVMDNPTVTAALVAPSIMSGPKPKKRISGGHGTTMRL